VIESVSKDRIQELYMFDACLWSIFCCHYSLFSVNLQSTIIKCLILYCHTLF